MTDEERAAIYERLTGFQWEPRWHWTGKYIVRRKGQLVKVRQSDVRGRWFEQGGCEVYSGEDYGKEY